MESTTSLSLERKAQSDDPPIGGWLAITPPIDEDYWAYRVQLGGGQAIVGFPKFGTIGVGFATEEDWNTNLPYTCTAEEIFAHIRHNKGVANATDEECVTAIRLIQFAAKTDRGDVP